MHAGVNYFCHAFSHPPHHRPCSRRALSPACSRGAAALCRHGHLDPTGVDNYCIETLRSSFTLDYARYEILFCVASGKDPVVPWSSG